MCGFIHDNDDEYKKIISNLDNEVINQIKEDRLNILVENDLKVINSQLFMVEEE